MLNVRIIYEYRKCAGEIAHPSWGPSGYSETRERQPWQCSSNGDFDTIKRQRPDDTSASTLLLEEHTQMQVCAAMQILADLVCRSDRLSLLRTVHV